MASLTRREFVTAVTGAAAAGAGHAGAPADDQPPPASQDGPLIFRPRGKRRLLYTSDPSNIAFKQVGRNVIHHPTLEQAKADPARPEDLVQWIDRLAHNRVDAYAQCVFSQGWTLYFRSDRFEYDARPQHQRFVPMMDAGVTPLEVLIAQSHERGMEFLAKFRMNDLHGHGNQGARFILDNPQWQLKEFPGGLDYSFEPVRDYVFSFAQEVVERFDVDGLLFHFMRWGHCFPRGSGRQRQPVMTQLLRRVRQMLAAQSRQKGKVLTFGVMVPQTLDECHDLGYDVPTWIQEGLIDMVCPCDRTVSDFNAPYEQFAALTRNSPCYLYPTMIPLLCRHDSATLLRPENYRALAQNFYGAGADGVTIFNFPYHWGRLGGVARYPGPVEGYPMALSYLREVRDLNEMGKKLRHYRFHPLHGGPAPTGAIKDDKIVLERRAGAGGSYRIRLCERFAADMDVSVTLSAHHLVPEDEIAVRLNGTEVHGVHRTFHPDGRLEKFGRPLPPFSSILFSPEPGTLQGWDNDVFVQMIQPASGAEGDVIIDEVEVVVIPS